MGKDLTDRQLYEWFNKFRETVQRTEGIDLSKEEERKRITGFYMKSIADNEDLTLEGTDLSKMDYWQQIDAVQGFVKNYKEASQVDIQGDYTSVFPDSYTGTVVDYEKVKELYALSVQGALTISRGEKEPPRTILTDENGNIHPMIFMNMNLYGGKFIDEAGRVTVIHDDKSTDMEYTSDFASGIQPWVMNAVNTKVEEIMDIDQFEEETQMQREAEAEAKLVSENKTAMTIPANMGLDDALSEFRTMYETLEKADKGWFKGSREFESMKQAARLAADREHMDTPEKRNATLMQLKQATNDYIAMKGGHATGIHGPNRMNAARSVQNLLMKYEPRVDHHTEYSRVNESLGHLEKMAFTSKEEGKTADAMVTLGCYLSALSNSDKAAVQDHAQFVEEIFLNPDRMSPKALESIRKVRENFAQDSLLVKRETFYKDAIAAVSGQLCSKKELGPETMVWSKLAEKLVESYPQFAKSKDLGKDFEKNKLEPLKGIISIGKLAEKRCRLQEELATRSTTGLTREEAVDLASLAYVDLQIRKNGMEEMIKRANTLLKNGAQAENPWRKLFENSKVVDQLMTIKNNGELLEMMEDPKKLAIEVVNEITGAKRRETQEAPMAPEMEHKHTITQQRTV